jgi:glycosyltransferase involved in cell wall biosynthesis
LVDVVIIRSNSIINTPRVTKIARTLRKKYSISVFGWNRDGISKQSRDNFVAELRLFNLKAPIGRPTLLLFFPLFWIWTFFSLITYRPQIVHACDLDSVIPCYVYKVIFRKKMLFDVCDRYALAYIPPRFKSLFHLVNSLEEFFVGKADFVVTVGEELLGTFRTKPEKCAVIMNCVDDIAYEMGCTDSREKEKDSLFRLAYTGNIRRDRGIEMILKAIEDLDGVEFVIAGRIVHKDIEYKILRSPKVKYIGLLLPEDALALEKNSDAIVALYDLEFRQNYFAMPNKLFEAMMCQVPIITNIAPEIVTDEVGCGFVVDYDDLHQIKDAIIMLRDKPELRRKLGNNGRVAYLQKYNWQIMEKKLLDAYEQLFSTDIPFSNNNYKPRVI